MDNYGDAPKDDADPYEDEEADADSMINADANSGTPSLND
jgi:hypothetical protein